MSLNLAILRMWCLAVVVGGSLGCVAFKAVGTTGKLAATTVIVAGKTATKAVTTSGKVASAAIGAGGSVTITGIESLAALARAGMVTLVDISTGALVRVPWQEGMTLWQAGELARLEVAKHAVAVVRGGQLAYATTGRVRESLPLQSGDVVRLAAR